MVPQAKVPNGERVRIERHRKDDRMIVVFDLPRQIEDIPIQSLVTRERPSTAA